jgi:hypothetical protein
MCRDPITGGILLDLRRVSGLADSHVMIFIIAVTVVFFILWTPLLVSRFSLVYSIQHYVKKFVSDLRQVNGFLLVFQFPPPIKLTSTT